MLYIISTPIGNAEDITLRALRLLREVDCVLAEDTRKTGFFLARHQIKKRLVSFFEHNETARIPWVLEELKRGKDIALVSSAGTPTISDPGYRLIRECKKESLEVTALPGPSSVINALGLTSIPHETFSFFGYLPRKKSARKKVFERTKEQKLTTVFFESPFRVIGSLTGLKQVYGNRNIFIAREMTKKFEETFEGNLQEALSWLGEKKPKGEFVLIVGPDS